MAEDDAIVVHSLAPGVVGGYVRLTIAGRYNCIAAIGSHGADKPCLNIHAAKINQTLQFWHAHSRLFYTVISTAHRERERESV